MQLQKLDNPVPMIQKLVIESPRDDVKSLRPRVGRDRPHLEHIVELISIGAVSVPEITTFSLSQAEEAQRLSESRQLRGKLVFEIR